MARNAMDEAHVKAAVLMHIRKSSVRGGKPVVTAELTLGSSGTRADLAVFAGDTIGIEIKTERDSLRRLSAQMASYSRYFDFGIAVLAPKHLEQVTEDQLFGASLWTYDHHGTMREVRRGHSNRVSNESLCDLLTQAERETMGFHDAMVRRYGKTSTQFWRAVARRSIRPSDLQLLSRFAEGREQARYFAAEREAHWSRWLAAQGCLQMSQSSSVSSAA